MPNRPEPRPTIRRRSRLGEAPEQQATAQPTAAAPAPAPASAPREPSSDDRVLIAHRVPAGLKRRLALAKLITGQDQERLVAEAIAQHLDQLGVPADLPAGEQAR